MFQQTSLHQTSCNLNTKSDRKCLEFGGLSESIDRSTAFVLCFTDSGGMKDKADLKSAFSGLEVEIEKVRTHTA